MKSVKKLTGNKTVDKKRSVKKYQPGGPTVKPVKGMTKSQAKAEEFYDNNPSVRTYTNEFTGKKIPTGPMTEEEYQNAASRAASVYNNNYVEKPSPTWGMKKGGVVKKTSVKKYQKGAQTGATGVGKSTTTEKGSMGTMSKKPLTPKAAYGMAVKPGMMKKGGKMKSK
jgi:hypothetical protein